MTIHQKRFELRLDEPSVSTSLSSPAATRLIFQNLVPSQKTNPVKSGGAEDQIRPIFVSVENILKDSEFANVRRVVVRCSAAMSDLTDVAVHLKTMIANSCGSIVKPQ
jgi:hypothetical protein